MNCRSSSGRLFVLLMVCGLVQPAAHALDPTRDRILYQVATAHLDTQWNWTIQDTINSYVPNTLRQNFTLFGKYPDYVFTFEGAFRYKLAREYYPADYATLTNYVAQGRWRVGGSVVDAGDVNVPSPESLMRHVLYGNGFWKREFGKTSVDIFLPDCFGFGYALPSVAAHCGLTGFSSQKLTWGSAIPIPFYNIGKWIGPDGNYVVAALQPGGYGSSIATNLAFDSSSLNRINTMGAATGLYIDYRYFGTGDTGGSPNDSSVNWIEQSVTSSRTDSGALINGVLSAASDQLFRDLTPAHIARLPSYQGELLMRTHGTGCYTAHPEMKQYNRQNELRADAAERISVIADWLQGGGTYPREKLNSAWERFLWHQFHDDLTGTSVPAAYTFSWNDELLSLNEFGSEQTHGAGVLAQALDTTALGVPLVVYNALSIPREDIVEAVIPFTDGTPAAVRVYDANGVEVPSQMGAATSRGVAVTFLAAVPANGAAVFDVRRSGAPSTLATGLSITTTQLDNPRYRVRLNANGDVSSIFDKANNRELLNAPIRWAFLANSSTSWPSWEILYSAVSAAPTSYLGGPPRLEILEDGPARVSLGATRFNAGSVVTERIRLAAGGAGDRVEWDVSLNWGSLQTLLKVVFPLAVTNTSATFDLGLGTVQRTNSNSSLYESPAQQWADLTGASGAYGVSILNDCKYGWDKPDSSTLRLTMMHTPGVGGSYVYQATDGVGSHRVTFAVAGHTNDWRAGRTPWVAARLNQPLQAFQATAHAGFLGRNFSLLSCDNSNVMVKAVKKAENSDEIVVRLQELTGQSQNVRLTCAAPITSARQITGAEEPLTSLSPISGGLNLVLGGYQPMTIALTLAPPGTLVSKTVSAPVPLPFNADAISTDGNRTNGDFDSGLTYPAELMPSEIVRDGVNFQIGPTNDGAFNAVSCKGQTINLPAGYDHLYFLAAAASNDITAPFIIDGQATNVSIQYFSGFIGQWSPPLVKPAEVGWVCTHRHTAAGANDAYRFCYLFKYVLSAPVGGGILQLPYAPNVRIFALSLARNTTGDLSPAGGPLRQPQLPWASAGTDRFINAGSSGYAVVTLDGSRSASPEGTIVAYDWSESGTSLTNGVQPVVNLAVGTHLLVLTVTDSFGGTSQDMVKLTVLTPLNVTISGSPTNSPTAPLSVQFAGQATGGVAPTAFDTTDDGQGTASAQGQNSGSGEVAANAFDNNTTTKWLDFANNNPSTRASWIQYQYANSKQWVVTNYTITSANDASERDPAAWKLLGSNDGGTSWTTLDTRTGQVFGARFQKLSFPIQNTTAYNVYRLQIDSVANPAAANSVQLSEIEFLASPAYSYFWSFGDGATSTLQNPQHTFSANGTYLVTLGASLGIYTGTNSLVVVVGPALTGSIATGGTNGAVPLTVQFTGLAAGGNGARAPFDTTTDQRGTVTAHGDAPPNESAAMAFDGLTTTKWLDFASAYPATRSSWIQYQYAKDLRCVVTQYTITSANDASTYSGRNPANWRLLASNDGGSSWNTIDLRSNQVFTANYQKQTFTTTNTAAYNLYRLQIDSVANPAGANSVQLSELELIGTPAYSFAWSFGDGASSNLQNPQHTYGATGNYTVTLTVSDGSATAVSSTTINVWPVTLRVSLKAGSNLEFSWPVWAAGYHLYGAADLTPPLSWSLVNSPGVTNRNFITVTIPIDAGHHVYQLRFP